MTSYKFIIRGVVQGVGFRPFVYNACVEAGLCGYVQNIGEGVLVVVDNGEKFKELLRNAPPLARIDLIEEGQIKEEYQDFKILESSGSGHAEVPADLYLCEDCLGELRDPDNRRFGYFFITCTNCGPRFTITQKNPYDRHTTTMCAFDMCDACRKEYSDPTNRRYHAQTIACKDCGPKLEFKDKERVISDNNEDALHKAIEKIKEGSVVAIKGVGGFHLVCSTNTEAVRRLKKITGRSDKPFSIMCRDIDMVKKIADINKQEEESLLSLARPIVIVKKKCKLSEVSELDSIGIMLPYTALHYLLFEQIHEPIVMTSANVSGEPIRTQSVSDIVQYSLEHDRKIENAADDSLVKIIRGERLLVRRSRGFTPRSIELKNSSQKTILALGAEMNASFCLWKDGRVISSQYLGNTSNVGTFGQYKDMLKKFLDITCMQPGGIVADMHPRYNTSIYAQELADQLHIPLIRVQHHKAHAYGAAAEHEFRDFSAIVCDGLGYGEDGNIWGGEVFYGDFRKGHLEEHLQLGGDSATRYPIRMTFSILKKFLSVQEIVKYLSGHLKENELQVLDKQYEEKFNAPLTSSCGRILDAVSALLGMCQEKTYDGRPAMLLEANSTTPYDLEPVIEDDVLMTTPLFEYIIQNIHKDKGRLGATAQLYLARGLYQIASQYSNNIVFAGGCAYNRIMSEYLLGQGVKMNKEIPPGDGGIAFGQVAYFLSKENDKYRDLATRMTRVS